MGDISLAAFLLKTRTKRRKATQGAVPTEALCKLSIKKRRDFGGKAIGCVLPRTPSRSESFRETKKPWDIGELRPVLCRPWQDAGRAEFSPGVRSNKMEPTIWATCKKHGYFFFPECKQVYNKTRTGKLTFYSLNFPWEEN